MYCRNCGKQLPDGTLFCSGCGASQAGSTAATYTTYTQPREPKPSVSFVEAIKLFFTHYVDFKGRSRRSEYWWACLFTGIVGALIASILPDISGLWSLATLIPSLAICVRRLHDIGKSGWWYLIILIPIVGQILMIVWFCTDSKEDNQWGPNPKY